jgi:hypothetical protein
MKAIRAVVENGQIVPEEPSDLSGRHDAIVVVFDTDPWDAILQDPRPRPELTKAGEEALQEHLQGLTTPLDPDNMP